MNQAKNSKKNHRKGAERRVDLEHTEPVAVVEVFALSPISVVDTVTPTESRSNNVTN